MEKTEVKKDMEWSQIIGIMAIVALAILIGGVIVMEVPLYFIEPVWTYPAWIDIVGIVVAIIVVIVTGLLALTKLRKRD